MLRLFLVFLNQMVVLFLIMLCGAIAYRADILNDDSTKRLSGLILNIVSPAMIMSSVAVTPKVGSISDLGCIVLLIISFYVAAAVVGALMPWFLRAPKEEHILYNAMAVFSNVGFIGIPIIGVVLGTQYIIYGALFVFFNTIVVYSYGIYIFAKAADRCKEAQVNLRSMFINPGMIASFAALAIFFLGWQLPPFLGKTAVMLGDMTGPLSMMVIGVSLAKAKILDVVASPRLWLFAVLRLFAIPLLLSYVYKPWVDSREIFTILVVMLSMPVGSITIIFSHLYDVDSSLVSSGLLLTTILSVITVPAVIFLAGI